MHKDCLALSYTRGKQGETASPIWRKVCCAPLDISPFLVAIRRREAPGDLQSCVHEQKMSVRAKVPCLASPCFASLSLSLALRAFVCVNQKAILILNIFSWSASIALCCRRFLPLLSLHSTADAAEAEPGPLSWSLSVSAFARPSPLCDLDLPIIDLVPTNIADRSSSNRQLVTALSVTLLTQS